MGWKIRNGISTVKNAVSRKGYSGTCFLALDDRTRHARCSFPFRTVSHEKAPQHITTRRSSTVSDLCCPLILFSLLPGVQHSTAAGATPMSPTSPSRLDTSASSQDSTPDSSPSFASEDAGSEPRYGRKRSTFSERKLSSSTPLSVRYRQGLLLWCWSLFSGTGHCHSVAAVRRPGSRIPPFAQILGRFLGFRRCALTYVVLLHGAGWHHGVQVPELRHHRLAPWMQSPIDALRRRCSYFKQSPPIRQARDLRDALMPSACRSQPTCTLSLASGSWPAAQQCHKSVFRFLRHFWR